MRLLLDERVVDLAFTSDTWLIPDSFCTPDASVSMGPPESDDFETMRKTAYVLRAGANVALGRFLTDAVPRLWSWRGDNGSGVIAGAMPTPQQLAVLIRAGLMNDGYIVIRKLTKFDLTVCHPKTPEYYVSADSRVLQLMDRLRGPVHGLKRVAIISDPNNGVIRIRNWASLTVALLQWSITPLDLSKISFANLAGTLASAELLIMADPSQAGLAGLCSSGARVVEILPEGFVRTNLRALCDAASLVWAPLFGNDSCCVRADGPSLASEPFTYVEVSIPALGEVLKSLGL